MENSKNKLEMKFKIDVSLSLAIPPIVDPLFIE